MAEKNNSPLQLCLRAVLLLIMSITLSSSDGCNKKAPSGSPIAPDAPKIKVAVFANGRITADGTETTIDSLRESFKSLAQKKGVVWYYREAAQGAPPPQTTEVIKEVIAARLPIRLSSRPDYSDVIGIDSKPIQQ